jgi:hypothetical protein
LTSKTFSLFTVCPMLRQAQENVVLQVRFFFFLDELKDKRA